MAGIHVYKNKTTQGQMPGAMEAVKDLQLEMRGKA